MARFRPAAAPLKLPAVTTKRVYATNVDEVVEGLRDGVEIDTTKLTGLHVDLVSCTGRVRPGTGRAGLARAARTHGLAIGELISAEVVTDDGRIVRTETADASGRAIVTGLEFRLVPAA